MIALFQGKVKEGQVDLDGFYQNPSEKSFLLFYLLFYSRILHLIGEHKGVFLVHFHQRVCERLKEDEDIKVASFRNKNDTKIKFKLTETKEGYEFKITNFFPSLLEEKELVDALKNLCQFVISNKLVSAKVFSEVINNVDFGYTLFFNQIVRKFIFIKNFDKLKISNNKKSSFVGREELFSYFNFIYS